MPPSTFAPHPSTTSPPTVCPHCGGRRLSRKGTRRKKLQTVQRWRCTSCNRLFTPAPALLRSKTYPPRVILDALTTYNLGYTLAQTLERIRARHGVRIASSTLSSWLADHRSLLTYGRLRQKARPLCKPLQTVRALNLYHRQVYRFAYHQPKLELLRSDPQHKHFAPLADFLHAVPKRCPHALFADSDRASQRGAEFIDPSRLLVTEKENAAVRLAALVLPTVGDNYRRHDALQRFFIANDSVTVAVEVPIWLTPADIAAVEAAHGISLFPPGAQRAPITGHIDFLQVRNDAVHILDYKPDARTNRPFAQLAIYALALSHLTGLPLFDFKCAWFNEEQYCEFFPRPALRKTVSATFASPCSPTIDSPHR